MKRSSFIDVIKGIAIILVIFTHAQWTSAERKEMLFPFWVNMAVPLFMLVSGYVYAKSYQRKNVDTLREAYAIYGGGACVDKLIRYFVPFLLMYSLQVHLFNVYGIRKIETWDMYILAFKNGGYGQGSYYYPLLVQFIFVYPVIHFVLNKNKKIGLLVLLLINIAYELLAFYLPIDTGRYRMQIYRYIFLIAAGSYIGQDGKLSKLVSALMIVTGLVVTYLVSYKGITLFFTNGWAGTSCLASMFIIPLFYGLSKTDLRFKPLELVGKASYNIFLVQMVWYTMNPVIDPLIPDRNTKVAVSILACVALGIGFYYLEKPITKFVLGRYQALIRLLDEKRT